MGGRDAAGRAIDRRQDCRPRFVAWLPTQSGQARCGLQRAARSHAAARPAGAPKRTAAAKRPARASRSDDRQHRRAKATVQAIVPSVTGAPGDGSVVADRRDAARAVAQGRRRSPTGRRPSPIGSRARSRSARPRTASSRSQIDWLVQGSAGQEARHGVAEERDPGRLARRRLGQDSRRRPPAQPLRAS